MIREDKESRGKGKRNAESIRRFALRFKWIRFTAREGKRKEKGKKTERGGNGGIGCINCPGQVVRGRKNKK